MPPRILTARDRFPGGAAEQRHVLVEQGHRSLVIAAVMPEQVRRPEDVDPDATPALAYVNQARWVADCPDCTGAELVAPGDPFLCGSCFNEAIGYRWRPVRWPAGGRGAVEAMLLARVCQDHGRWEPGHACYDPRRGETLRSARKAGPFHHSWATPHTWTTGDVITAANLNISRDNENETMPAKVTTAGDTAYATGANAIARLAAGGAGQRYRMHATTGLPVWDTAMDEGRPQVLLPPGATSEGTVQLNVNTTLRVAQVFLPYAQLLNRLAFEATAVAVAGTIKFAIFSLDGATRHVNAETASVSGAGQVATDFTAWPAVAAYYYVCFLPNGTADVTVRNWQHPTFFSIGAPAGDLQMWGTLTVTASTMPATITPGSISVDSNSAIIARVYS